ncbi:MAG: hypothetical protein JO015_21265 [Verrucomicrobia bacterium]|nr:hypothetical protein [Verrucomicrobiota bacterium]
MKKLWIMCLGAGLGLASLTAQASITLDWNDQPQGTLSRTNQNTYQGSFTASDGGAVDATVQLSGNVTAFRSGPTHLQTPAVTNTIFDGGLPSGNSNLAIVANFNRPGVSATPGTVEVTLDFAGYKQGVKNVTFDLFDVDARDRANFVDQIQFITPGVALTAGADNTVTGSTVTGTGPSPNHGPDSGAGNVRVAYGYLPLHQIVFDFTSPTPNRALHGFAISNLSFAPVPEASQLAIGLAACAFGALWLRKADQRRTAGIA